MIRLIRSILRVSAMVLAIGLTAAPGLPGQVLARPGWAGSGVAPESWWVRAVFYRLNPARFQDSDGDGRGDLAGVAQRLDYLQSLGIDAVLLDAAEPVDTEALGNLVGEASRHHLRVLVRVPETLQSGPRNLLLKTVQSWLGAGAAGVWAPKPMGTAAGQAAYPGLVAALRAMIQSFPGERVLLIDPVPMQVGSAPNATRRGVLVTAAEFPPVSAGVVPLRSSLLAVSGEASAGANPLLRLALPPATDSKDSVASATLLLGSRGAVILDSGAEIGLDLFPAAAPNVVGPGVGTGLPVMQWTPSNHTPSQSEHAQFSAPAPKPGSETEFGPYHPYMPPPRALTGPTPSTVHVVPDMNIPAALPPPDSLPGFTSAALPVQPVDGAKLNVTTEDRDPKSLLTMFRELIAIHHGNATLRNGSQVVLNHDAEGVLVWIRRAPAGSRTVADVVIAANVTDRPVTLAIDGDLQGLGMRPGALRMLFGSAPESETGESTGHLALPSHGVFVGEVYRAGAYAVPGRSARRGR